MTGGICNKGIHTREYQGVRDHWQDFLLRRRIVVLEACSMVSQDKEEAEAPVWSERGPPMAALTVLPSCRSIVVQMKEGANKRHTAKTVSESVVESLC